jgi:hypothetical protein
MPGFVLPVGSGGIALKRLEGADPRLTLSEHTSYDGKLLSAGVAQW